MAEEIASHADERTVTARFYSGWWTDVKSLFLATGCFTDILDWRNGDILSPLSADVSGIAVRAEI
jgi:hypothetical protein